MSADDHHRLSLLGEAPVETVRGRLYDGTAPLPPGYVSDLDFLPGETWAAGWKRLGMVPTAVEQRQIEEHDAMMERLTELLRRPTAGKEQE